MKKKDILTILSPFYVKKKVANYTGLEINLGNSLLPTKRAKTVYRYLMGP
jgi:hypothetical protein